MTIKIFIIMASLVMSYENRPATPYCALVKSWEAQPWSKPAYTAHGSVADCITRRLEVRRSRDGFFFYRSLDIPRRDFQRVCGQSTGIYVDHGLGSQVGNDGGGEDVTVCCDLQYFQHAGVPPKRTYIGCNFASVTGAFGEGAKGVQRNVFKRDIRKEFQAGWIRNRVKLCLLI